MLKRQHLGLITNTHDLEALVFFSCFILEKEDRSDLTKLRPRWDKVSMITMMKDFKALIGYVNETQEKNAEFSCNMMVKIEEIQLSFPVYEPKEDSEKTGMQGCFKETTTVIKQHRIPFKL